MSTTSAFTRLYLYAILLLSATAVVVRAGPAGFRERQRGCGTHISAERRIASEARFKSSRLPPPSQNTTAVIPLYFHIVYANKTAAGGWVPPKSILKQVEILNNDYKPTRIRFELMNVTRIENANWFNKVAHDTPEETEMKESFRYGNASSLNVWTVGFNEGDGSGLLGFATFPSEYADAPEKDGVVLLYSSMPDIESGKPPYNRGRTLTHEAGHWCGLYHTFEGGCTGTGDSVDDTPPESEAAYGCPQSKSSCPGGLQDPVANFMNYSDDICMTEFTPGQRGRVRAQLRTYRRVGI